MTYLGRHPHHRGDPSGGVRPCPSFAVMLLRPVAFVVLLALCLGGFRAVLLALPLSVLGAEGTVQLLLGAVVAVGCGAAVVGMTLASLDSLLSWLDARAQARKAASPSKE